jgi:hypothetical protein
MRTACVMVVFVTMTMAAATPAFAAGGATDRPFRLTSTSTGFTDLTTGDFFNDGTVTGTHFGTGSIHTEGNLIEVDYVTTITAANGDLLISRFADFANPGDLVCPTDFDAFAVTQSFTGGTGRFTGATGTFFVSGCMHLEGTASSGFVTGVGTISY